MQETTAIKPASACWKTRLADNWVRLIDAFIDKLELHKLGFSDTIRENEGRPPYAPAVLLKLYLYDYLNKMRSSRKLEKNAAAI